MSKFAATRVATKFSDRLVELKGAMVTALRPLQAIIVACYTCLAALLGGMFIPMFKG